MSTGVGWSQLPLLPLPGLPALFGQTVAAARRLDLHSRSMASLMMSMHRRRLDLNIFMNLYKRSQEAISVSIKN
ncbi:hypothetical protein BpHYR1_019858 [Brachionus plicatilis]|uniref:Uncharacterized protein n=1 Tax=Brachionus plicatilis TaxID=10195 RepID=A0A3M7R301_BRAPC|nr:hypothetical protein BpHYR1_019858 [Brachionus plicatilis]